MSVLITRASSERRIPGRVYITTVPLCNAYSSTKNRAEATRFDQIEAERLIAEGKWSSNNPQIEVE